MLTYLEGLFEAGERRYAEANRALYDEVFESDGGDVLLLLGIELQPMIKTQALKDLAGAMGERGDRLTALLEKAVGSIAVPRGLDYCADFLRRVAPKMDVAQVRRDLGPTGRLLDWCFLTVIPLPAWGSARDSLLEDNAMFQLELEECCAFAQGLYRYDEPAYRRWLSAHRDEILGYLTLHTDSLALELSEDVVTVEFLADGASAESGNRQAVSRLNALRSALPFVAQYSSRGNWLLPFGLTPSVDDTRKDIPSENLPLRSDVAKNVVWHHVAESPYLPDSYFRFEEAWYALRTDALLFVASLGNGLPRVMAGKPFNARQSWEQGDLLARLAKRLDQAPPLPPQAPDALKDLFKDLSKESPTNWRNDFRVFFQQFLGYLKDVTDKNIGRLMVHNFRDAARSVPAMHEGFARLGDTAPDYLGLHTLDAREARIYPQLVDLLEVWALDPPATPQRDITHYIRVRRDRTADERMRRIEELVAPVRSDGNEVQIGGRTHFEFPFRHVALTFSVSDPCHPEDALAPILRALASDTEVADFIWAIPTYRSARFTSGAYRFTSMQLYEVQQGGVPGWESFVPCDVPSEILQTLPDLPNRPLCGSEARTAVLGLVAAWEQLAQYRHIVHSLERSTHSYERELTLRHRERLSAIQREIRFAVETTVHFIEEELGHLSGDSSYDVVNTFLRDYAQDPDKHDRDHGDSRIDDLNQLSRAMDDLVRRADGML